MIEAISDKNHSSCPPGMFKSSEFDVNCVLKSSYFIECKKIDNQSCFQTLIFLIQTNLLWKWMEWVPNDSKWCLRSSWTLLGFCQHILWEICWWYNKCAIFHSESTKANLSINHDSNEAFRDTFPEFPGQNAISAFWSKCKRIEEYISL